MGEEWYNDLMDFTSFLLLLLVVVILFFGIFSYFYFKDIKRKLNISEELVNWLKDTSQKIDNSSLVFDNKLNSTVLSINTRIDRTMSALADVQKTFGELTELSKTVKDVSLIFRNPKGRGSVGEIFLETIIKDVLPRDAYRFQYTFKTGDKVDAVVITNKIKIPIDSKFPMENFIGELREKYFIRDVKKHIEDVAIKYIRPEEGTTDYALLYIPSEAVFYEVIIDETLSKYAQQKRILLTPPMSLYMYLKAIIMSYQGQKIQESTKGMLNMLSGLMNDFNVVKKEYDLLYKHISHTYKQSHTVSETISRVEKSIDGLGAIRSLESDNSKE